MPEREESRISRGRQVDVAAPRAHHPRDHSPLQEEGFRGRLTIEACLVREGKSENPRARLAVEKYIHASWLDSLHDHGPGRGRVSMYFITVVYVLEILMDKGIN